MGKSEERRPPESGREPGENTAVAGLIMGIAAVVFWFFGYSGLASVVLGILGLIWTDKAKKEGYEQLAAIFTETANNEKEHAKIWFKLLMENGEIPDTLTCLKMAAAGENEEHTSMYPRMAAEAKAEGFTQIAALFTMVAAIEKDHEERYKALAANIQAGKVYARETEQVWQCRNCGFVYIGQHAPVKCPVCAHPQSYFELKSSNY